MRLFRPCFFAGCFYPEAIFRVKTTEKILLLTFDDGPDPESTPRIIETLDRHDIKAIFFCCGKAAERYPDLIRLIKSNGHKVGNHGYSHTDGWKVTASDYLTDIERADIHTSFDLFRPPFGHLTMRQYLDLKVKYKIMFWDLMPYDFDKSFSREDSLRVVLRKLRPGSVIVLHDHPRSDQAAYLDSFIETVVRRGYRFSLPDQPF